ncbi:MAG: efflux RND transporter periplasmic adaptor subunit [Candidatus Gracilibacteria bacterium]|nr:efflux RND transporter periplasmic adaptor subunit [Candidatus Gracilibacteria bacterium]
MKKIFIPLVVTSLILTSCGKQEEVAKIEQEVKNIKTETIIKKDFEEQIKLVGKVAPIMETPVSSQVSGTIKEIKAEVGKQVKIGDVLATIDLENTAFKTSMNNATNAYNNSMDSYSSTLNSIRSDLESTKIQLQNAKMNRNNTYISTDKQLEITETQLANIKKTKENTTITTEESIKSAQISVDLAFKSLANSKTNLNNFEKNSTETLKTLEDKKKGLLDTTHVTIENSLVTINSSITQADILLGVTTQNKNVNDAYEMYLGAKDSNLKVQGEALLMEAKNAYDSLQSTKDYISPSATTITIEKTIDVANKTNILYEKLISILDNSITSSTFSQAQLDAIKGSPGVSGIAGKQSSVLQIKPSLVTLENSMIDLDNSISSAKINIETTRNSLNNAIDISETQYNNAKQALTNIKAGNITQMDTISGNETLTQNQLESTLSTIKSTRDGVDNAVKIAEAQYNSTKSKLDAQESQVKAQVDSAKGGKDLAKIQLNNTLIVAPFDGVIMSRNIEIGSMASPGVAAFSIGTQENKKVKIDVSAENMMFMKFGQQVLVSRGEKTYTGTVTLMSPSIDSQTKMFKVEIGFLNNPKELMLGDFVDVILNQKKGDMKKIVVPFSAIIGGNQGEYSVFTIGTGSIAKSTQVKLGSQNSTEVEITSGLNEGDKVVITGAMSLQDGDLVKEE